MQLSFEQTTQRAHNAIITSSLRPTFWRNEDVIIASLLRHVSVGYNHWSLWCVIVIWIKKYGLLLFSICLLALTMACLWWIHGIVWAKRRHNTETLSALLALCEANPSVTNRFPAQRASNAGFLWCFLWCYAKQALQQTRWFEMPWCPLLRHRSGQTGYCRKPYILQSSVLQCVLLFTSVTAAIRSFTKVLCCFAHQQMGCKTWDIMMTSSNGSIFRVTGHLCGEFTGPRWIPHTKASDAELRCLLGSAPE